MTSNLVTFCDVNLRHCYATMKEWTRKNIKYQLNLTAVVANFEEYQGNMSVKCIPPFSPLLYSENGVYRGIPIFFLFLVQNIDYRYTLEPPRPR